ncbi:SRPBCC family protein [Dactylosporangium sp. AC04546]|uniref:SRPBCC family protein n=1 Tax=Dactylosporangium sp. AC04546 TaxID=2862460 RepID=UPI001EDF2302|nr:SRPBCC family protein [Dactylosporangium sp. AC04546]WVK82601.1 SRPBCC family protein [Dactylosporangium sp. AC04546]
MSTARESIEVAVPVGVAYEQLTHFENYPQFMSGIMSMAPIDGSSAHMVLDLGGNRAEFDARITESRPGEFLCWEATSGPQVIEALRLEPMADDMTRVIAELQIDARELMPAEQHAVEVLNRRLKADLKGFKRFCERQSATGAEETAGNAATQAGPAAATTRRSAGSIARDIASASGLTHAPNERPNPGMPPTGNLGPMQHNEDRIMRARQSQHHGER